ncbi:sensor histidine kinase [Paenibacillus sp. JZ16]|uniref:sensor histidine kinase n=1 Tax=Paenibacillus sp. JZ16 TaxID=1906272 RepID=UPI00188AE3A5|nr:sensor histidine kinase [Paenibacillus sp. JZ16]
MVTNKKNKLETIHELFETRKPILIWLIFVYAGSVTLQFLDDPRVISSLVFTGLFVLHAALHWISYRVSQRHFWFYFGIQGILIYLCAILFPGSYQAVLVGLLPVLIAQSLGFSFRISRVILIALISIIIFFDSSLTVGGTKELLVFIPIFVMMLIIVIAYGVLFFHQVHERVRLQKFLNELQAAHQKVEELTLSNERQRMARDLHDTLAQGVAGLIMQLEASNAHIMQGNTEKAHNIIIQSMQQARRTLAEARRAIDDLRIKSAPDIDFKEAVEDEVRHFRHSTGIQVDWNIQLNQLLSRVVMEHSLHIVREVLTNVARHANANVVKVSVIVSNNQLQIEISDNGKGFNPDAIGKEPGHYGLLGIRERARLIGGHIKIDSSSEGTTITMSVTINEGGQHEPL